MVNLEKRQILRENIPIIAYRIQQVKMHAII